jgi:hypothetical protein
MRLVHNARRAWRWFSVQAMALAGAVQATWVLIPDDMRASVPPDWVALLTVALLVLGVAGRLVDQGGNDVG